MDLTTTLNVAKEINCMLTELTRLFISEKEFSNNSFVTKFQIIIIMTIIIII
jgi:hypothetical protein